METFTLFRDGRAIQSLDSLVAAKAAARRDAADVQFGEHCYEIADASGLILSVAKKVPGQRFRWSHGYQWPRSVSAGRFSADTGEIAR